MARKTEKKPVKDVGESEIELSDTEEATLHPARMHDKSGIVYVGHIPHGFYEHEMRGFMSQFGKILRIRMSRNKHTGKSKHYAFVEFDDKKVAAEVAETMDKYLLSDNLLSVKLMDDSRLHKHMWKGADKVFTTMPEETRVEKINERVASKDAATKSKGRLKRLDAKHAKLKELGVDYDWEKVTDKKTRKTKK